tara:strand:- start:10044 stop:11288 length:1245 start_codon:yes stop_codon:yes gene_type:complete
MISLSNRKVAAFSIFFVGLTYFFVRPLFTVLKEVYSFGDINFAIMSLPFLVVFIFLSLFKVLKHNAIIRFSKEAFYYFILVSITLMLTILVQISSFGFLIDAKIVTFSDFFKVAASSIYGYFAVFFVGLAFYDLLKNNYANTVLFFAWGGLTLVLIYAGLTTPGGIFLHGLYSYLTVSDSYAILSLMIISFVGLNGGQYSNYIKVLLVLIAAYCLFTLVSRTAFYFFIFSSFFLFLDKPKMLFFGLVIILLSVFFVLPILQEYFWVDSSKWLSYDRMFRVVEKIDSDNSFNERLYYNSIGLLSIRDNWFLGDFMGEFRLNMEGKYMHNYLSFYRQFGLLPFIFLLLSSIVLFRGAYLYFIKKSKNKNYERGVAVICLFILTEAIFSRAYWYTYVFFMLGLLISYCNHRLSEVHE